MSRQRNPRVVVVQKMRAMKGDLVALLAVWVTRSDIYEAKSNDLGRVIGTTHRKRRPDEYPEAHRTYWVNLHTDMAKLIEQATEVQEIAAQNYRRLTQEMQKEAAS